MGAAIAPSSSTTSSGWRGTTRSRCCRRRRTSSSFLTRLGLLFVLLTAASMLLFAALLYPVVRLQHRECGPNGNGDNNVRGGSCSGRFSSSSLLSFFLRRRCDGSPSGGVRIEETTASANATTTATPVEKRRQVPLPLPVQVIDRYKRWRTDNLVDDDTDGDTDGGRYVLAYYQCPYAAGNRIHEFLNGTCAVACVLLVQ